MFKSFTSHLHRIVWRITILYEFTWNISGNEKPSFLRRVISFLDLPQRIIHYRLHNYEEINSYVYNCNYSSDISQNFLYKYRWSWLSFPICQNWVKIIVWLTRKNSYTCQFRIYLHYRKKNAILNINMHRLVRSKNFILL